MSRKIYVKKANKEKTDEICKDICDGYVATMVNSDDIWEIAHRSAMEMAEWKEKEMLDCAVDAYCECCDTKECEDYFDMGCECDWKLKFEKKLLKKIKK